MKTMKAMKSFVAGSMFAFVMIVAIAFIRDYVCWGYLDMSDYNWIEILINMIITVVVSYIGHHILNGIKADVTDFKKWRMERSLEGEAA